MAPTYQNGERMSRDQIQMARSCQHYDGVCMVCLPYDAGVVYVMFALCFV